MLGLRLVELFLGVLETLRPRPAALFLGVAGFFGDFEEERDARLVLPLGVDSSLAAIFLAGDLVVDFLAGDAVFLAARGLASTSTMDIFFEQRRQQVNKEATK